MENIVKLFVPAFAALTLSAASLSANALTAADLYGQPASTAYAERTIVITPQTRFINVTRGEVVNVKAGSRQFAWDFNGLAQPFELNKVAPEGALDHSVRVYIAAAPEDNSFGE